MAELKEKVEGHQHPWCSLAQDPWEELVGGFHVYGGAQ